MTDTERRKILASKCREAREYLGFTVAEIATSLGWEPAVLERIEAGGTTITGEQVNKLSRIYKRPVEWLMGEFRFEPSADVMRMVENLSEHDHDAVLAFAEFLQCAGPPTPTDRRRVTDLLEENPGD